MQYERDYQDPSPSFGTESAMDDILVEYRPLYWHSWTVVAVYLHSLAYGMSLSLMGKG